jgi:hypothetical protein
MRRVARHLFTLCSAASLLLCVAVGVLWVRSHWAQDVVALLGTGEGGRTSHVFASAGGRLGVERQVRYAGPPDLPRRVVYSAGPIAGDPYMVAGWGRSGGFWQRMGLASAARPFAAPPADYPGHRWAGVVPYWMPCAALAILPALWLARRTRRTADSRLLQRAAGIGLLTTVVTGSLMDANVAPAEWGWQPLEWTLALLAGAAVGIVCWRRGRARDLSRDRAEHGLCPTCGYDLRATPGHCPECGMAKTMSSPAAPPG